VEDGVVSNSIARDAMIDPYSSPSLPGVELDLRDNTNAWGSPPSALQALAATNGSLAAYPGVNAEPLVAAIAAHVGVAPSAVVVGCGSDDLIDAAFRAYAQPGDRIAHPDPTFSMVPRFARLNGVAPIAVPLRTDGSADIDALLASRARLVYVASPNNPTGTCTSPAALTHLVDRHDGVVLVDEAYAEFSELQDLRALAAATENLVVFRTFSKAWGLAGLRVGYAIASEPLARALTVARGPYRVTTVAQEVVRVALEHDAAWVASRARDAVAVRTRLERALAARKRVRVIPSQGNFVFAAVEEPAMAVAARFQSRGIAVRAFDSLTGYGDAIRFGVVAENALAQLLQAIEEVFA
jgi:histidinol-phosphate aminotransferase